MLRHGRVERTLDLKEKSTAGYLEYTQTLYNYLVSFFGRALPLVDIQAKIKADQEDFESAWRAEQVEGWEAESSSRGKVAVPAGAGIWCPYCMFSPFQSPQIAYSSNLSLS